MVWGKYGMKYRAIRIWVVYFRDTETGVAFSRRYFFFKKRAEKFMKERREVWKDEKHTYVDMSYDNLWI